MTHTIETVKEELPKVQVKIGKKIVAGMVTGRRNRFATVWVQDSNGKYTLDHEFSWQTIVNALNNDRPLLV